ncbi:unnamed protein product [Symbiodinium necroappetens]|uniref:Uncharacterized protein n=1 Tax=Symbiodinium necroappetens TaxID=1628268 RepID=A0A812ITN8_9DINO|nr:unnamed protein product [Symbiodinium necroappetens]
MATAAGRPSTDGAAYVHMRGKLAEKTPGAVTVTRSLKADKAAQQQAHLNGWLSTELEFHFIQWNFEARRMEPMQDDRSLSEYKGEMATFILSFSLLTPASTEAMLIFKQWFASAALLLMSLRLKLACPQPSPLIKRFKRRWDGDGPGTQVKVLLAALVARLDEATPATGLCRAHLFPLRTT